MTATIIGALSALALVVLAGFSIRRYRREQARLDRLAERIRDSINVERGFTLIELLIVLVIIGILLAIAVPSYLGIKDKANQRAAQSDIRNALVSVEEYNADNGGYTGMTRATLLPYDAGLDASINVKTASATTYCIEAQSGGKWANKNGPAAQIVGGAACP